MINTDAEGRLILAMAVKRPQLEPISVDVATLTGAVVVALGKSTSGLFVSGAVGQQVQRVANRAGDRVAAPLVDEIEIS